MHVTGDDVQKVIAVLTIFDDLFSNTTLTHQNRFNDTGKSLRHLESMPRHSTGQKANGAISVALYVRQTMDWQSCEGDEYGGICMDFGCFQACCEERLYIALLQLDCCTSLDWMRTVWSFCLASFEQMKVIPRPVQLTASYPSTDRYVFVWNFDIFVQIVSHVKFG